MTCPNCGSHLIKESVVTEWFPYGNIDRAFEASFPVMECSACNFGWRDFRAEEAIDSAMSAWLDEKLGENLGENK